LPRARYPAHLTSQIYDVNDAKANDYDFMHALLV